MLTNSPQEMHTALSVSICRRPPQFAIYRDEQRLKSDRALTPHGYIGYGSNNFVGVFLVLGHETRAELKWLVWGTQ